MGNANSASVSRWDDLFQALTRPNDLKHYIEQSLSSSDNPRQSILQTQIDLIAGTLQVDVSLLRVNEVAESFDTATFCLGQLVSHEPQLMSEVPFAMTVVTGLSSALRKGWLVHHGVGKFAANALTILCVCETAASAVREHAIDVLLSGLVEWLHNEESPQDVDEVCGCNCGCAALSATCWLERLLGKPDKMLEDKIRSLPTLPMLCRDVMHVVTRREGNPFSLTRLLSVPEVFQSLLKSDPELSSDALSFLTFGLVQFHNPMFTEDAVQAIQALLREPKPIQADVGDTKGCAEISSGAESDVPISPLHFVLSHRASLPLFEALSTAACYLPSAMIALEMLSSSATGRLALYSLAAALSKREAAASAVATDKSEATRPQAAGPQGSEESTTSTIEKQESADIQGRLTDWVTGPGHTGALEHDASGETSQSGSLLVRQEVDGGSGLITRVISEAGQLASKIRAIWTQKHSGARTPVSHIGWGGSFWADADAEESSLPSGVVDEHVPSHVEAGNSTSEVTASALIGNPRVNLNTDLPAQTGSEDEEDSSEGHEHNYDGLQRGESHEEHPPPDPEQSHEADHSSVEAWDHFVRDLPIQTVAKLTDLPGIIDSDLSSRRAHSTTVDGVPDGEEWRLLDSLALEQVHGADVGSDDEIRGISDSDGGRQPVVDGSVTASPDENVNKPALMSNAVSTNETVGAAVCSLLLPAFGENEVGHGKRADKEEAPSHGKLIPTWPNRQLQPDIVKAWVLLELVGFEEGQEAQLLARMSLSDKRVWLSRRLYREHHGAHMVEEEPLLFIECKREESPEAVLNELRTQYKNGIGLAGDLTGTLEVHFKEENSAGSAVKREWFSLLSDAFLAPSAELFQSVDLGRSVRPVAMSESDERFPALIRDLEMFGRFLGLALLQQVTIGVRLHASVCRMLLNNCEPWDWSYEEIIELDPALYQHKVRYILDNDVEPLCLDFTDVVRDSAAGSGTGSRSIDRVDLIPGGSEVEVTEQNKAEFVRLVCEWRLFGSIRAQCEAISRGFCVPVPRHIVTQLAQLIQPADLTRLLAGEANIDVADWERNCACAGGMQRSDKAYRWFWRAVHSFSIQEQEQLLQFVTGSRRPPVGGFAHLEGFNGGIHKFTLFASIQTRDSLPRAHACICTIDLPEYSSYKTLRRALHTALSLGCVGFDDAAIAADEQTEEVQTERSSPGRSSHVTEDRRA